MGYTVSGYLLDRYPLATLKDHNGQQLEAEVVATFLPSEVVESLYTVMEAAGLAAAATQTLVSLQPSLASMRSVTRRATLATCSISSIWPSSIARRPCSSFSMARTSSRSSETRPGVRRREPAQ